MLVSKIYLKALDTLNKTTNIKISKKYRWNQYSDDIDIFYLKNKNKKRSTKIDEIHFEFHRKRLSVIMKNNMSIESK